MALGAEAIVYRVTFLNRAGILKLRLPKAYRHPELDIRLTSRRLMQEARTLLRLRKEGLSVPAVYFVNPTAGVIVMEEVSGVTLREYLEDPSGAHVEVMKSAGKVVAQMHMADIIHGDLTTSNLLVEESKENRIVPIDFGLSSMSCSDEDMAVDLYVLERAVMSTRPREADGLNSAFLLAYSETFDRESVLRRLKHVRARGRKRDMTG